jgi:hypothetical protein
MRYNYHIDTLSKKVNTLSILDEYDKDYPQDIQTHLKRIQLYFHSCCS